MADFDFRWLVVEVGTQLDSNTAIIQEIQLYDEADTLIPFTLNATDCYDDAVGGVTAYWTRGSVWGREHIYNGVFVGSSLDSALVNYCAVVGSGDATRFVIDFGSVKTLSRAKIATGSSASSPYRKAENISIYGALTDPAATVVSGAPIDPAWSKVFDMDWTATTPTTQEQTL